MGAYENPQQVVDTQSGNVWANAIANIGKQTVGILNRRDKAQSDILKQAEKNRLATIKENQEVEQELLKNTQEAGILNTSYQNLIKEALRGKQKSQSLLKTGVLDGEGRIKEQDNILKYESQLNQLLATQNNISDYRANNVNQSNASNTPGRQFSGDPYSKNNFSKEIGQDKYNQNVILQAALYNDGKVIPSRNIMYSFGEDGNIMTNVKNLKGENIASFNTNQTMNAQAVNILNIALGARGVNGKYENGGGVSGLFKSLEMRGKDGKIKPEYLQEPTYTITGTEAKKDRVETATAEWTIEASNRVASAFSQKADGIMGIVRDRRTYNNINATYLSYAGENAVNLEKKSDFTLSDKGKEQFKNMYMKQAGDIAFGGKPFEITQKDVDEDGIVDNYEYTGLESSKITASDKRELSKTEKAKDLTDAQKIGEFVRKTRSLPIAEQVATVRDRMNTNNQDISYDPKTGIITETIKNRFQDTTTGREIEGDPEIISYSTEPGYGNPDMGGLYQFGQGGNKVQTLQSWNNRVADILFGESKANANQAQKLKLSTPPSK